MPRSRSLQRVVTVVSLLIGLSLVLGCQPAASAPTAAPPKPTEAPKPAAPAPAPAAAPAPAPAASPAAAAPAAKPGGPVAGIPEKVEFVVHTDPGGGGDLLAREIIEMVKTEKLAEGTWTVNNQAGGGGAKAMAYMANQKGRGDLIALNTNVWLATPLTSKEVKVSYRDLTPVSRLLIDVNVMVVRGDSPYKSFKDFVEAAKAKPNEINQSGGSVTAQDNLAREILIKETGAKWNFLSFPGGGERIAAVLGGNADLMITQPAEIGEQIRAGKLRAIAAIAEKRLPAFPDVPTLAEQGYKVEIPESHRGILGPNGMPSTAVEAYGQLFKRLTDSPTWKAYIEKNQVAAAYLPAAEFKPFLDAENGRLDKILGELGMKAQ